MFFCKNLIEAPTFLVLQYQYLLPEENELHQINLNQVLQDYRQDLLTIGVLRALDSEQL